MRLSATERVEILRAVRRHFGTEVRVRLVGSRVDDAARGGDIDLFLDGVRGTGGDIVRRRTALLLDLHERLGEQRIDVVIHREGSRRSPIHDRAEATGIPL